MSQINIIHEDSEITIREGSADRCLIEIGNQKLIMSFDAAFELALKLATYLDSVDEAPAYGADEYPEAYQ